MVVQLKKNKFIFRFIQSYYTIDINKPNSAKGFFAPAVTSAELAQAMPSYSAPVYVAGVNYGRAVYVCVQSDYSFQEIKSEWEMNVKAAIEVKVVEGSAETNFTNSVQKSKKITASSISVTAIGGSAQGASGLVTATNISEIAKVIFSGANWGKDNPGLPISYKLCRLSDNQTFSVVDYNEYTIKNCQKTFGQVNVAYFKAESGSDNDIYGSIAAKLGYEGEGDKQGIMIWQKGSEQACNVPSDNKEQSGCIYTATEVFNFDISKKDKMYIRIETSLADRDSETRTGFVDRDDPYDNTSTTIKLSDTNLRKDGNGNYVIYIQTTANVTESKGKVSLSPQFLKVAVAININL